MMKIGEEIRRLRRERGMTLFEVSSIANVTKSYISMLENGKKFTPSIEIISGLAKALNVSKLHLYNVAGYLDDTDILELVDENKRLKDELEELKNALLQQDA